MHKKIRLLIAAVCAVIVFFSLSIVWVRLYGDFLWMEELGQTEVFWTWFKARIGCFAAGFVLGSVVVGLNLWFVRTLCHRNPRGGAKARVEGHKVVMVTERPIPWSVVIAGTLLGGVFGGLGAQPLYEPWLLYLYQVPFEVTDPLFGKDAALFLFSIPFLRSLLVLFNVALIVSLLGAILLHSYHGTPGFVGPGRPPEGVFVHLSWLVAAFLLGRAPAFLMDRYDLVVYGQGVSAGAGYVDANVRSIVLVALALLCVVVSIFLIFTKTPSKSPIKLLAAVLSVPLAAALGLQVLPLGVQNYRVAPNELALERPYIQSGISMTLKGFGLENISTREIDAVRDTEGLDLNNHLDTIVNIRLWDWNPLLETYRQLQALRQYYTFNDADIDRYTIEGDYRQTMLAARQITWDNMDEKARTWVNVHLKYTHGYGAVMSPVNEVSSQGQPSLWVRDIPPVTSPGLSVDQPAIYFGDGMPWFVLGNSDEEEMHYPDGDSNVYTRYDGEGGILLSSWVRRLTMAAYLGDLNLILSGSITPQTRLLFDRDVKTRLQKLAPGLTVDKDPYLVLNDGRFYWIADMYTTSNRFPYSQHERGINYIRNSVKAVVDAYHGTVHLYVVDPDDPLLATFQRVYPSLFTPVEECPESLREHFRYPEQLFSHQASIYQVYHMTDPRVFYNKEDVWTAPTARSDGKDQQMDPYYMVMRLPGEERLEFLLMLPFVPRNRDNLIGWMAGRCDAPHYGQLVVYQFPKDRLLYGPRQIQTRIEQNTLISQQIALWDQAGSQVIRGSLLVIPIEGTLIYVQPLYLKGRSANLPELKRVIVAAGERVIMAETLEEALATVMGQTLQAAPSTGVPDAKAQPVKPLEGQPELEGAPVAAPELEEENQELRSMAQQAANHYRQAEAALKEGDWAGYGREMDNLKKALDALAQ